MYKNIILDIGMVLVDFCWEDVLKNLGMEGEVFDAVADATVRSPEWNEFDRSAIPDEELLAAFVSHAPVYKDKIQAFWDHMAETIRQYSYAKPWIAAFKENGLRVYILSNYSRRTYKLTYEDGLDFLPLTDGAVFSFETGYTKPEKEIYQFLMEKYRLEPEECIYIDDNATNLVYPAQIGWQTICFDTFAHVQEQLQALGIFTEKTQTIRE